MATIAERIQQGLDMRGMKQSELVCATEIGKSSISTYLSGNYEPKQRNIYKIAKALDVNEAWLMGYDVPPERKEEPAKRERDVFAHNFRRLLELRGKTQSDVAVDLEITSSTVSDWANAKKYPRVDKMQTLAEYLGVLISDLREEKSVSEVEDGLSKEAKALLAQCDDFSESEWAALADYAELLSLKRKRSNGL